MTSQENEKGNKLFTLCCKELHIHRKRTNHQYLELTVTPVYNGHHRHVYENTLGPCPPIFTQTELGSTKIKIAHWEFSLTIIMKNNIFKFIDTFWLQLAGTVVGTPPSPNYVTLYFTIIEIVIIPQFPKLQFYKR